LTTDFSVTVTRVRWIIDAMNVIGSRPDGWWKNRRAAMAQLVEQLERWSSAQGQAVTVVFERPTSLRSSAIEIAYASRAAPNSADDEILRHVCADGDPTQITVVTSDATLGNRVRQLGASVYPAGQYRELIDDAGLGDAEDPAGVESP
jgi:predicted RNA-binding protein with PIN domain